MSIEKNPLKQIPSLDLILQLPACKRWKAAFSPGLIKAAVRESLEVVRSRIKGSARLELTRRQILKIVVEDAQARLDLLQLPRLTPVINATGIILHTGLGRAPLSTAALKNLQTVLQGYCNLEFDLTTGKRGERNRHVSDLICQVCGAEEALVVNNNAAALLLTLNTFCSGKEAVISRGQLIEIGGSFRIPDVMEKSGARMREVGTTNKTRLDDYGRAINRKTGAIVVAHTSNYRVLGFTEEVALKELADLAHEHRLPLIHDLGGGVLVDLRRAGLPYEPLVQDSIKAGVDVVTFSGDKVLGGPQSGLIVGKKIFITKLYRNPLLRALRCDKLTYATLEPTLRLFLHEKKIWQENNTLVLFALKAIVIKKRGQEVAAKLAPEIIRRYQIRLRECHSQAGSGALPLEEIKSHALVLRPAAGSATSLAGRLRAASPPVVGYVQDGCVWLDLRTVFVEQLDQLVMVLNRL